MLDNAPDSENFRRLFESLPGLYIVLLPDFTVSAVSDSYLRATMRQRETVVGRNLFDVFPENPDDGAADGMDNTRASLEKVLQTGEPQSLPVQKYDVQRPASEGGAFEERYWSIESFPFFGEGQAVAAIIHRVKDVTEIVRLENRQNAQNAANAELKTRAAQMETGRRQAEAALEDARMRLEAALEVGEIGTWTLDIPGGRVYADRSMAKIFSVANEEAAGGDIENYLRPIHPDDRERTEKILGDAIANLPDYSAEFRVVQPDGAARWVIARGKVVRDENNNPVRLPGVVIDITDRKESEERLRESQERFQLVARATTDAVWDWDLQTDSLWWNDGVYSMFGYAPEAVEPTIDWWYQRIHPDDRERVVSGIHGVIDNGGEKWSDEYRFLCADAVYKSVFDRGFAIHRADKPFRMLGGMQDITGFKQTQKMLTERTRLATLYGDIGAALSRNDDLQTVLHHCTDALVEHLDVAFARVWTLDKGENVLKLRASSGIYTHLDGAHARVPVGKFKIGLIAEERRAHLTNDVANDPRVSDQDWARREGMTAFAGYPLLLEDRLVGVMCVFSRGVLTDATLQAMRSVANSIANGIERRHVEEELKISLTGEREARTEAENANRLKDDFLATLSHELRTPLTSILGWARILGGGALDPEQTKRALETIERNAKAQSQLIEDVLDVSRIVSGNMRLDVAPVDLQHLIETSIDALRPAADAKNIRLQTILDTSVPPISGDADRLRQVIWNLLSNAVKFTHKGGRVQIKLKPVNSHIELTVADDGQGIDHATLPFVFERFRQSDGSTTRKHGGLGLGLAIVRHLVELHGGSVTASSAGLNQGAVFTVSFPLAAIRRPEMFGGEPESRAGADDERISVSCPPQLSGLRVLAVDDEADTRFLLASIFEGCGARITVAASVAEALERLNSDTFDVLISDVGMPEHDGYELIARVRKLSAEEGGRIPAIALTAYARTQDRLRILGAGFQMHVPKPVEPAELLTIVASVVDWKKLG